MADYGIFGHGSGGNSWFANRLDDFHDSTKKYDPAGHYAVEWPMKGAHGLVEKSSGWLADAGIGEGFNRRLNEEANENQNNFGLGSQRMGLGILGTLGAMYGYGAMGGGESAAGMTDGAFLGEGVASGVPAWDGAAGGMGLGFDPNGLGGSGSSLASDFPNMGGGNSWLKLLGNMGQQTQRSGQLQAQAGAAQSDALQQQIMADLLRQEAQTRAENAAWQANQRSGGRNESYT